MYITRRHQHLNQKIAVFTIPEILEFAVIATYTQAPINPILKNHREAIRSISDDHIVLFEKQFKRQLMRELSNDEARMALRKLVGLSKKLKDWRDQMIATVH